MIDFIIEMLLIIGGPVLIGIGTGSWCVGLGVFLFSLFLVDINKR